MLQGLGARGGEPNMKSRRKFLMSFIAASIPAGLLAYSQDPPPLPRRGMEKQKEGEESNTPKPDPKLLLEANQKEIKRDVEHLYDLASELKAEVEKTDSVQVLSLSMLRKTEEIEKLAKGIRSRAKG
jgi:hypothetical protein